MLKNAIRNLVINKTLSVVYNNFLKALPGDGSIETSRNMLLWDMKWSLYFNNNCLFESCVRLYFFYVFIYMEMMVGVLTTCHTQYTWDRSMCIFLFNRTTLQVFVTYLTSALYVHPLWFYKHQHDNCVRSKLFAACQRWWFHWRFWFVPSVPGYLREEEEHKTKLWEFLDPYVQLHTAISSVLFMTSC